MQVTRNVARKFGAKVAVASAGLFASIAALAQTAGGAEAAATAAVTGAQTTGVNVALAILGMVVAIWAIFKIIGFFGRK